MWGSGVHLDWSCACWTRVVEKVWQCCACWFGMVHLGWMRSACWSEMMGMVEEMHKE